MSQKAVGSIWIALAVGVLTLAQNYLGADMTASLVAALVGLAAIIRDAWIVVSAPEETATRGAAGPAKSKIRRFLLGG